MEKKFVKTTFAILSFMMLLPTSVFAEDAGDMEAAFVGESGLEADQSASYSDADSTLPFEEEKNNPTDEKIPETEEQTPEKTDSENQNSDLDGFISGDASAEDEKKTIHVIIENGNTGRYEKNDFKGRYPPDPKKSRTGSGYEKAGWKVLSWNAATPWDCTGHYGRSSLPDSG